MAFSRTSTKAGSSAATATSTVRSLADVGRCTGTPLCDRAAGSEARSCQAE